MKISAVWPLAALLMSQPAFGACPGSSVVKIGKASPIAVALLNQSVFFRTSTLALDFDGSPRAYGVRDQGYENICVGLAPSTGSCRGKYRGSCYKVCQQTFAAWSRSGAPLKALSNTMCSVGLGGDRCSIPDLQLQNAPSQDWFVSETSLKTSPSAGTIDRAWLRSQGAQLDAAQIRYLVVPSVLMASPWNVRFGDVGIAFAGADGTPIAFVVGDGGNLGEGSEALLTALEPTSPPKPKQVVSALGENVPKYKSGLSGDFRFVIFGGTASLVTGRRNVTTLSADVLQSWVDKTAGHAFKTTDRATVLACTLK